MTITNWPMADRPREKLLLHGAKYLSDAELIAILFQTGMRGKTALDLAREVLIKFGGLKTLLTTNAMEVCQQEGIGKAKYALLQAGLELGLRYQSDPLQPGDLLNNPEAAKRFLISRLQDYPQEVFACLFLDTLQRVICFEELFYGTINESSVYPREILKRGLKYNAAKVILAHNHPSGSPQPSQADCDITLLLKETLALVDIQVIDHIIVGHRVCVSLAEGGYL